MTIGEDVGVERADTGDKERWRRRRICCENLNHVGTAEAKKKKMEERNNKKKKRKEGHEEKQQKEKEKM